ARLARQRRVTEAFMAASREGDLERLIAVLDPDVVLHSDAAASPSGVPLMVRGAAAVAGGARAASARARYGRIALVNGTPGLIVAPRGRLMVALAFTFSGDKISQIDVIGEPDRLAALDLAVLD
ncbi:MAG TPA: RNA polymerase subunit sigma-70, partial [Streptosporangiaceae bacterium]